MPVFFDARETDHCDSICTIIWRDGTGDYENVLADLQERVKKKQSDVLKCAWFLREDVGRYGSQGQLCPPAFCWKKNYQHLATPHTRQIVSCNTTFRTEGWEVLLTEPIIRQLKARVKKMVEALEASSKIDFRGYLEGWEASMERFVVSEDDSIQMQSGSINNALR